MSFMLDPRSGLYYKTETVRDGQGRTFEMTFWINPKTQRIYESYEDALHCRNPLPNPED